MDHSETLPLRFGGLRMATSQEPMTPHPCSLKSASSQDGHQIVPEHARDLGPPALSFHLEEPVACRKRRPHPEAKVKSAQYKMKARMAMQYMTKARGKGS